MKTAKSLGFHYTCLAHLVLGNGKSIVDRFILPKDKDKIFTLIELDTGKEYDCITNTSLFIQLKIQQTDNDNKYVYELKSGRQKFASIANKVFCLKGNNKITRWKKLKNYSIISEHHRKEQNLYRRIANNLRGRIRKSLRATNAQKKNKTENLIGCKFEYFMGYLEAKFTRNMNWANYGENGWHIDHIIPCLNFDLTTEEGQKKAFHYTNIQPLWATTEIAMKYGEANAYIGNLNKNDMRNKHFIS